MKPFPYAFLSWRTLMSLSFLFFSTFSPAQEKDTFDIVSASYFYPQRPKLHKIKFAVMMLKYKFPEAWLEGSYHVPFLNVQSSMGLHKNFAAQLSIGTIVVSNEVAAGFRWNKKFNDKFSFSAGYDLATVFGSFNQQGFDSQVSALIHYPNMAVGWRYRDIAFTLKGDLSVVGRVKIRTGENTVTDDKNFYNGFNVGLYMEQRLWKDHVIILGLKNTYCKFNYIAWPAFSTFNRYYNIPEISFGLVL